MKAGVSYRVPLIFFGGSSVVGIGYVFVPGVFPSYIGGYEGQRFLLLLLLGLLSVGASTLMAFQKPSQSMSILRNLLPVVVLSISFIFLAAPFSGSPYVWVEPGMYALFFLATAVSGACLFCTGSFVAYIQILLVVIVSSCFLYAVTSVNLYLFSSTLGGTISTKLIPSGFFNIRYWSHVATWVIPLLPLAVLVSPLGRYRLWRSVVTFTAGVWWWLLIFSSARGSVVGIFLAFTLTVLLFGRKIFPWAKIFLFHLSMGFVVWVFLSLIVPSFLNLDISFREIKASSSGRVPLFYESWQMSLESFPFGMGPQSWLTHEIITDAYRDAKKFAHPHNMYLLWAAEYGWVLIAILGVVVCQAILGFWKAKFLFLSKEDYNLLNALAAFTASISAALIHAGVSAVFMAPASMLVGTFTLIAFWSLIMPRPIAQVVGSRETSRNYQRVLLIFSFLVFLGWVSLLKDTYVYYSDMRKDEVDYMLNADEGRLPRFWLHGNFPR